jgi:hypothetical protein
LKDRTNPADARGMTGTPEQKLDVTNTAAFDLAIELLTIALRHERDPNAGRAEILRERFASQQGTDQLRDRVSITRRLLDTVE